MPNVREMMLVLDGKLGGGLKSAAGETVKRLDAINKESKKLAAAKVDVGKYRALKAGVASAESSFAAAQAECARLAREIGATDNPSKRLSSSFAKAQTEAGKLKDKLQADRTQIEQLRRSMLGAGVSSTRLSQDAHKLDIAISENERDADALRKNLSRLENQERANARASREQGGALKANLASIGKTVLGYAGMYLGARELATGIWGCIKGYREEATEENRVFQLMKRAGGATRQQVVNMKRYAEAQMYVTTLTHENIERGAGQLATFQLQAKSVRQLIPALEDLEVGTFGLNATSENAQHTANMLGRVFTGQVGMLRRVGISFSKAQQKVMQMGTEQQKVAMLVKVIDQNYGGLARRMAQTPEGKAKRFANAWGEVKEAVGKKAQPAVDKIINYLNNHLPEIEHGTMRLVDAVSNLATKAKDAGDWIVNHWSLIKPIVYLAIGATLAYKAVLAGVAVAGVFNAIVAGWRGTALAAKASTGATNAYIVTARMMAIGQKIATAAQWLFNTSLYGCPIVWIIAGIVALGVGVYMLVKHWDAVKGAMSRAWTWFSKLPIVSGYIKLVRAEWSVFVGLLSRAWGFVKMIWEKIANSKFGQVVGKAVSWVGSQFSGGGKVQKHAAGGFVNQRTLSWLGEAGREAVIPMSGNRSRSKSLWRQAGAELGLAGAGGGGATIHFAPVMNFAPGTDRREVQAGISAGFEEFKRNFARLTREQRRTSIAE